MKKNNIFSGAFILAVGGVLSKVFSAVYRIVLTNILGGEGIGVYQLIFPFYSLCVVIATAGLPLAISKVVSKNVGNETNVLKKCLKFTFIVSSALTLILFLSSRGLAILQGETKIFLCYMLLAPTIIVIGIASVLRGYFQGKHNFLPSSISNILEQFVKMVVGLVLSLSLISIGVFAAVVGAVIGIVLSEIVSLLILLLFIKKDKKQTSKKKDLSIKNLVKDILPITLTNIILPFSNFLDSVLVVNLLGINFSKNISVFLYGLESGAVSSLVSLPTIFSFAIASVILPSLSVLTRIFNKNHKLSVAIKIVLIITIPCAVCFALVPNRVIKILYQNKLSAYGLDGIGIAGRLLAISGLGIPFLAVNQIYSSSLQAVDERYKTIRNLAIAVSAKLVIELIFLPAKALNVYVLAISNTLCYFTVFMLNHVEMKRFFIFKLSIDFIAKLVLSNCLLILTLVLIMSMRSSVTNTMLALLVGAIVYVVSLFTFKIFNKKDKALLKYKV